MRASHGLFIDLWRNPYVSDQLCAYGFDTVDATYAHSEYYRPALSLCATQLGWMLTDSGGLGGGGDDDSVQQEQPRPDLVYLPPTASRFPALGKATL